MSTAIKLKFLFILLMLSQQVLGSDRYFMWVDPETKLRVRINVDTFELLKEQKIGSWKNEGKIKLDPEIFDHLPLSIANDYIIYEGGKKIRILVGGMGRVYDYFPLKKEIIRIDQTFHSGYNFNANKFLRKGIIYSIGGEGFWNYNTSITYFDEKLKEWEIIRPKNKGPFPITDGYQGYHAEKDAYYSGASTQKKLLETEETVFQEDLYLLDFKTNKWQLLGKLSDDLPFKKNSDIIWTGKLFLHFFNETLYIIDPIKNEVNIYKDNKNHLGKGFNPTVHQDTLSLFRSENGGPILKLSISEIKKNSTYFGKFYTNGISWYWYYIGLLLIVIIMTILKWKRKQSIEGTELIFTELEKKFLNKLLDLEPNEYLNTFEINDILDASDKSQENQRKIRFNVIGQINKKLKSKYNWDNSIERKPLPEDKRLTVYMLDPLVLSELKRLMR
jgi:hypothetical protein